MWRTSLLFRRVVSGSVVLLAALAVYFAAQIPRPVKLPNEQVNKAAVAMLGQELRIYNPLLEEGDTALSYAGAPNETAEVWLDDASLTGPSRLLLGPMVPQGSGRVVYTDLEPSKDTGHARCRTTVIVRRAQGARAPETLELAQKDPGSGEQQFRQILLRSPATSLALEVHTDSETPEEAGLTQCPRSLKIGSKNLSLPGGPLYLLVLRGWINLRFVSADPKHPVWLDSKSSEDNVSLGDDGLEASGLDVLSTKVSKTPLLHVHALREAQSITLSGVKIAAHQLNLDVGKDGERADASAEGKAITTLNVPDLIQKNLVLSALAGVLIGALTNWVRRIWFAKDDTAKESK